MITPRPVADTYDVVIIGSGPAGLSAAMRLAAQGVARIAVIESGSLYHSTHAQRLSEVTGESDLSNAYFAAHSQRIVGGTSSIWGGWCAVLEQRAFEQGEWAIDYQEIDRYYPDAAEILEVPSDALVYRESAIENSPQLVYKPFYRTNPVRFGHKYRTLLAGHQQIDLIINQTCVKLLQQGANITAALLRNSVELEAPPIELRAAHFVLACGGLGNARLLQLSGVASASPVGHHLMDHPHIYNAAQLYLDKEKIQPYLSKSPQAVHAFQLSTASSIQQGLLSFSVAFDLAALHSKPLLGKTRQLALTDVTIRAEMPADPANRVALGTQTDALGQPKGHVRFRLDYDHLARHSWQVFAEQLLKSGLGRPSGLPSPLQVTGGGHLMGTTRMGMTASDSVVDAQCKVHTTNNLYIAGSSIFPAGGAANPTLTIVALALRLGDHLSDRIKRADHG